MIKGVDNSKFNYFPFQRRARSLSLPKDEEGNDQQPENIDNSKQDKEQKTTDEKTTAELLKEYINGLKDAEEEKEPTHNLEDL